VQARLEGGRIRLFTRRGHDWTPRFAALASALTDQPANNPILDGEVIVQGETGVADFDALQADLAWGRSERMVYFAFDLFYLDGFDLRMAPLIQRKRVLAALLEDAKSVCFHLAQHLEVAPALEVVLGAAGTLGGDRIHRDHARGPAAALRVQGASVTVISGHARRLHSPERRR
jgi:bifunctional non-homologous end joining protein LigD